MTDDDTAVSFTHSTDNIQFNCHDRQQHYRTDNGTAINFTQQTTRFSSVVMRGNSTIRQPDNGAALNVHDHSHATWTDHFKTLIRKVYDSDLVICKNSLNARKVVMSTVRCFNKPVIILCAV